MLSPTPSLAVEHGVEAIALSNHGGRQLDSAPAPVDLITPVLDAVGDRLEVICDGGVRRGADIVKAVASAPGRAWSGAPTCTGSARPVRPGVDHAFGLLDADVRRTMALVGATKVSELDSDLVVSAAAPDPVVCADPHPVWIGAQLVGVRTRWEPPHIGQPAGNPVTPPR